MKIVCFGLLQEKRQSKRFEFLNGIGCVDSILEGNQLHLRRIWV